MTPETMTIPRESPYYDRIRALKERLLLVSIGGTEYRYLIREIREMTRRATNRLSVGSILRKRSKQHSKRKA
jgi:hypothetical protein